MFTKSRRLFPMSINEAFVRFGPPDGILTVKKRLTKRQVKKIERAWKERYGA